MMLLLVASAFACDQAIFSAIPAPALSAEGRGVDTGEYTLGSTKMVGARLVRTSAHSVAQWQPVLKEGDKQDDWMPAQFGYEEAAMLDGRHMYLRFDIGFLLDAVRVKRQLVVQLQEAYPGNSYRSCWMMVDPTPHLAKLHGLVADVAWEKSSQGWWEVSPRPEGGSLVTYQWWTEASAIPSSIMRYGMSRTLPDLMDAFEVQVGKVAGK